MSGQLNTEDRRVVAMRPVYRAAPKGLRGEGVGAVGDAGAGMVRLFFYEDVVEELVFAARYRRESGFAILLGVFGYDESGPFIEVSGFEEFGYVSGADGWYAQVREALERVRKGVEGAPVHAVGLFASVARSEGRLDEVLAMVHLSLFNIPFQPVMVCDMELGRLGVFVRPEDEGFENVPFYVVGDRSTSKTGGEPRGALVDEVV